VGRKNVITHLKLQKESFLWSKEKLMNAWVAYSKNQDIEIAKEILYLSKKYFFCKTEIYKILQKNKKQK